MNRLFLEIRIEVPNNINQDLLNDIGEQFQLELPVEFEQNDIEVKDVTYELVMKLEKENV